MLSRVKIQHKKINLLPFSRIIHDSSCDYWYNCSATHRPDWLSLLQTNTDAPDCEVWLFHFAIARYAIIHISRLTFSIGSICAAESENKQKHSSQQRIEFRIDSLDSYMTNGWSNILNCTEFLCFTLCNMQKTVRTWRSVTWFVHSLYFAICNLTSPQSSVVYSPFTLPATFHMQSKNLSVSKKNGFFKRTCITLS